MEQIKIIAGFTNIRNQFRTRVSNSRDKENLELWFSFKQNILCAHDYDSHNTNMVIAAWIDLKWRIYLNESSYGEKLVKFLVNTTKRSNLEERINNLYKTHGHINAFKTL